MYYDVFVQVDHSSVSKGSTKSISSSCSKRSDDDSLGDRDVPLHASHTALRQAQHSQEEDRDHDSSNDDWLLDGVVSQAFRHDRRQDGGESENGKAEEGNKTVGDGIFLSCDKLKFLNHHDFQEAFLIFAEYLNDFFRDCRFEAHFVVEMDHFSLFRLKVILDFPTLPSLLLEHILVVTLGAEVVSYGHAEPVTDHRGDSKRQNCLGLASRSHRGNGDDEGGAEAIESAIDCGLDVFAHGVVVLIFAVGVDFRSLLVLTVSHQLNTNDGISIFAYLNLLCSLLGENSTFPQKRCPATSKIHQVFKQQYLWYELQSQTYYVCLLSFRYEFLKEKG